MHMSKKRNINKVFRPIYYHVAFQKVELETKWSNWSTIKLLSNTSHKQIFFFFSLGGHATCFIFFFYEQEINVKLGSEINRRLFVSCYMQTNINCLCISVDNVYISILNSYLVASQLFLIRTICVMYYIENFNQ